MSSHSEILEFLEKELARIDEDEDSSHLLLDTSRMRQQVIASLREKFGLSGAVGEIAGKLLDKCLDKMPVQFASTGGCAELPTKLVSSEGDLDVGLIVCPRRQTVVPVAGNNRNASTWGGLSGFQDGGFSDLLQNAASQLFVVVIDNLLAGGKSSAGSTWSATAAAPSTVELRYATSQPARPGYLRLLDKVQEEQWMTDLQQFGEHSDGRLTLKTLLKSKDVPGEFSESLGQIVAQRESRDLAENAFGQILDFFSKKMLANADAVVALRCPGWPKEAQCFVTRSRSVSNWPTRTLIADVIKEGCHVVKLANRSNVAPEHEYRFLFSVAESKLIRSLSSCQKYCYHLLRLLLKRNCLPDDEGFGILRTYHLKTLMLWSCERRPCSWWNWKRIITCCTQLLMEMFDWLAQRRCPNYFIPDNNMFDHVPPTTDVSREMQFVTHYADEDELWAFVIKEEKLLYPSGNGNLETEAANLKESLSGLILACGPVALSQMVENFWQKRTPQDTTVLKSCSVKRTAISRTNYRMKPAKCCLYSRT